MSIVNDELVSAIFGSWPSFHDAEILSVELKRGLKPATFSNLTVCVNNYTVKNINEGTARFETVRDIDVVITLAFYQIEGLKLDGFNHQNVIDDIVISAADDKYSVVFQSIFGLGLEFTCEDVAVISVVPLSEYKA